MQEKSHQSRGRRIENLRDATRSMHKESIRRRGEHPLFKARHNNKEEKGRAMRKDKVAGGVMGGRAGGEEETSGGENGGEF